MEKVSFNAPALYGDHHVSEAHRILLELSGVSDVYASSAFHVIEVTYDPAKIDAEAIQASLDEAGYLNDLPMPAESGVAATADGKGTFFRHTTAYEQAQQVVSFAQTVSYSGRPLWYCPGMGVIERIAEGE